MATREVHLLRHAKSSWDAGGVADRERPLNDRGHRACASLTRHLQGIDFHVDRVLCSSAVRARETLAGIQPALSDAAELEILDTIYLASSSELLDALRSSPASTTSLLLVGHNPGIGELATSLAGDGDPDARASLAQGFPTGALASLSLACSWHELGPGQGTLSSFVRPRELA